MDTPARSYRISHATCSRFDTHAISRRAHWRRRRACRARRLSLESGSGNPSLTVLLKVSNALDVPLDELLASPRAKVRKWEKSELASQNTGRGVTVRSLITERMPDELLNVMEFAPGASMRGSPHLPGTREYFTCLGGEVTIFVAGERYDLASGDVLAFPGNLPHSYRNPDANRHGARRVGGHSCSGRRV